MKNKLDETCRRCVETQLIRNDRPVKQGTVNTTNIVVNGTVCGLIRP